MSPPGKTMGSTTKESVVKARRSPWAVEAVQRDAGLVLQRREQRVVEMPHQQVVDELVHGLAAAAVGEGDAVAVAAGQGFDFGGGVGHVIVRHVLFSRKDAKTRKKANSSWRFWLRT